MISATTISPLNRRILDAGAPPFSFGNALKFDGVNDRVTYSPLSLNDFTVSFWSKTTGTGGGIIDNGISNNYIWQQSSGTVRLNIFTQNYPFAFTYNLAIWNHIVVIRSGTTARCYLNGVESVTGPLTVLNNLWTIVGMGGALLGVPFDGTLDEIAIWDTALTSGQITSLYNSGNGDFATNYSPANLQAYWRCNEEDGATTLVDEQGTYDGTLNNFSTPPAYFIPH